MTCVDLRQMTAYRLVNELTGRRAGPRDDPWELVVPGWCGDVSPFGGDLLIASTRGIVKTRQVLAEVPGAVVNQDADDGANILFPVEHFAKVAALLRLRKRRTIPEGQRAARIAQLRPFKKSRE